MVVVALVILWVVKFYGVGWRDELKRIAKETIMT
jgi:hypothetical protein